MKTRKSESKSESEKGVASSSLLRAGSERSSEPKEMRRRLGEHKQSVPQLCR